jgi:NADPH:quinone reductase-like Zn-dependent oxidoreductase
MSYSKYGGPEVLQLVELNKPVPKDNEVLVKIHAVSINDWDWAYINAKSFFDRLLAGLFKPKHPVMGSDIAGVVEAIGKNVKRFQMGDRVYGDLSGKWGGFAEYVCAGEKQLEQIPATMNFEEAAAIPQAGMLAYQGLIDKGELKQGQKILINGAGGGVGTLGIQIAKLYGAEVTVVDSAGKLDMLKTLGAAHLIDYTKLDFTATNEQYDLVFDAKTNRKPVRYLRVLKPGGKYVTVGGSIARIFQTLIMKPWISLFTKKKVIIVALKTNKDLEYFNRQFEAGLIRPYIGSVYPLESLREAFQLFSTASHKGKIVITIAQET